MQPAEIPPAFFVYRADQFLLLSLQLFEIAVFTEEDAMKLASETIIPLTGRNENKRT